MTETEATTDTDTETTSTPSLSTFALKYPDNWLPDDGVLDHDIASILTEGTYATIGSWHTPNNESGSLQVFSLPPKHGVDVTLQLFYSTTRTADVEIGIRQWARTIEHPPQENPDQAPVISEWGTLAQVNNLRHGKSFGYPNRGNFTFVWEWSNATTNITLTSGQGHRGANAYVHCTTPQTSSGRRGNPGQASTFTGGGHNLSSGSGPGGAGGVVECVGIRREEYRKEIVSLPQNGTQRTQKFTNITLRRDTSYSIRVGNGASDGKVTITVV